jgi:stage V sporulation protein G
MNYNAMKKADLIAYILKLETKNTLEVTSCQVYPFKESPSLGNIKGIASIVLNDGIQIRGLRITNGENGLYVGYPTDPFYKGEDFRSICCPITRQLREHIESVVLEHYQTAIGKEVA